MSFQDEGTRVDVGHEAGQDKTGPKRRRKNRRHVEAATRHALCAPQRTRPASGGRGWGGPRRAPPDRSVRRRPEVPGLPPVRSHELIPYQNRKSSGFVLVEVYVMALSSRRLMLAGTNLIFLKILRSPRDPRCNAAA